MADTTTGLIFNALLNEQSGTAIVDRTGLHANGTLNDTLSTVQSPQPGRTAIQFNGTTNYISFADANDLDQTSSFSVTYWAKVASGAFSATAAYVLGKVPVADLSSGYSLGIRNGSLWTTLWPVGVNYFPGTPDWNDGNWHHLAHVITVTAGNAVVQHYTDGVFSSASSSSAWSAAANSGPLIIGDLKAAVNGRFVGALSDLRIYNRVLAVDDIKSLTYIVNPSSVFGVNIGISV